jgi:hypothetical protein
MQGLARNRAAQVTERPQGKNYARSQEQGSIGLMTGSHQSLIKSNRAGYPVKR